MTIEEAIKKAEEGGWIKPENERIIVLNARRFGKETARQMWLAFVLSRPDFWQSLEIGYTNGRVVAEIQDFPDSKTLWHRFIDHLADGGTPESYFENFK